MQTKHPIFLNNSRGFSLSELLVVLALVSIIALMAVPGLADLQSSVERRNGISQLDSDLRRSRAAALSEGARIIFDVSASGSTYIVGIDYAPYNDPVARDQIMFTAALPNNISTVANERIIFDTRGFVVDNAGDPTTETLSLEFDGTTYISATLFPTGFINFSMDDVVLP